MNLVILVSINQLNDNKGIDKMTKELTQEERQRRGAKITAMIVGGVAFGIFLLTLYLSLDN